MTERRYNEDEVALILRKAVDARADAPAPDSGAGLTLQELQDIGAEVGIEAAQIEHAARAIDVRDTAPPTGSVLGQPTTVQFDRVVPVRLRDDDLPHLLDVVRGEFARQGIVSEVLGGFEWRARSGMGGRYVSIRPDGDQTRVQVLGNFRDGLLGAVLGAGPVVGFGTLGLLVKAAAIANPLVLFPVSVAAALAPVLPFRALFSKERESMLRVTDAIEERLRRLAAERGDA